MNSRAKDFAVLGLDTTATVAEVKRAYRALAATRHPDRGGTVEAFGALNVAYLRALGYASSPRKCEACEGRGATIELVGLMPVKTQCRKCGGRGTR